MSAKVLCVGGHLDGEYVDDMGDTIVASPILSPLPLGFLDPPTGSWFRDVVYRKQARSFDGEHYTVYVLDDA